MGQISGHSGHSEHTAHSDRSDPEPMVIDCDHCAVRGPACGDCAVSVLLGVPGELLEDERAALDVLAEAGMAPRLRLVPIRGERRATRRTGVA